MFLKCFENANFVPEFGHSSWIPMSNMQLCRRILDNNWKMFAERMSASHFNWTPIWSSGHVCKWLDSKRSIQIDGIKQSDSIIRIQFPCKWVYHICLLIWIIYFRMKSMLSQHPGNVRIIERNGMDGEKTPNESFLLRQIFHFRFPRSVVRWCHISLVSFKNYNPFPFICILNVDELSCATLPISHFSVLFSSFFFFLFFLYYAFHLLLGWSVQIGSVALVCDLFRELHSISRSVKNRKPHPDYTRRNLVC